VTRSSSRLSAVLIQAFLFSGVSWHKNAWMAKFCILGPNPARNTPQSGHRSGPVKPSIPRSTRRVRAHIAIEQPTTITLSVRGCLGGRSARGVQGSSAKGRPIRFVPSLLKFEHIHAKLTMAPDAPPGDTVMGAWEHRSEAPITAAPGGASGAIANLAWMCSNFSRLSTKRMGRPFADDPCTPLAEQPTSQPCTLSVTVAGCSVGI
jgi:hypothetical protein